jgi:hypothetical protein
MKHIVLGFVVVLLLPLTPAAWLQSFGRGLPIVLSFLAVAQVFIGVTKLGREGHDISDTAGTVVVGVAAICALAGTVFIVRKSRRT